MSFKPSQLQHFVPDEILVQLGELTVCFSLLEQQLKRNIASLLKDDWQVCCVITAERSFQSLRALLSSLCKQQSGQENTDLLELNRRCARVEERRNQLVHSDWGAGNSETGEATRSKTTAKEKRGLRHSGETMKAEDVAAVVGEMKILVMEYQMWHHKLLGIWD